MKDLSEKEVILVTVLFAEFILLFNYSSKFWLTFAFMIATLIYGVTNILNLKSKEKIINGLHFFALPIFYFLGVFFFLSLIKVRVLQIVAITLYSVSNVFLLRSIRRIKRSRENPLVVSRNIISLIGLITIFLVETDIVNAMILFKLPIYLGMAAVFTSVWAISYFLYWQYRDIENDSTIFITLISFVMAEIFWAGNFWITSYPTFEIGTLGVPVLSITSTVVYYCFWGIAHHKLENGLTKKILLEYIMISLLILSIILFTSNWLPVGFAG